MRSNHLRICGENKRAKGIGYAPFGCGMFSFTKS